MPSSPFTGDTDLLSHLISELGLSSDIGDTLASWLLHELEHDRFARLEQAGHSVDGKIPLARVFIDLDVVDESRPRATKPTGFVRTVLGLHPQALNAQHRLVDEQPSGDLADATVGESHKLPLEQRARKNHGVGFVVIGGPGQGKSTLGQLLCQVHRATLLRNYARRPPRAREAIDAFAGRSAKKTLGTPATPCLPIRLVLSETAAWLANSNPPDENAIVAYIAEKLRELARNRHADALTLPTVEHILVAAPLLLVLDGLDEVPASSDRDLVLGALRKFFERMMRAQARGLVVATTRPQGYAGELESLGISLSPRLLVPLTPERALQYAAQLADARFAEPPERRKRVLDRLRQASSEEATARLMQSPLQVTILATLVDRIGRAPDERWSLFRDYYRVIYEREMERPIAAASLLRTHRAHIDKIHAQVGLLLQVESERSGGTEALMTPERLMQVVEEVLADDGIDRPRRTQLAEQVVRAARERLVFLVEITRNRLGFEIRSLQEFMAAFALSSKSEPIVSSRLREIAKTSSFRNVMLFIASRCFTELSDLRSIFTDELCPWMNTDTDDPIARAALAGSVLALEMLEEGSPLNQPLYARKLTELATRLIETAPSRLHTRLARVVSDTTRTPVADAIASQLRSSTAGSLQYISAWTLLINIANYGHEWARQVIRDFWPADQASQQNVLDNLWLTSLPTSPNEWIWDWLFEDQDRIQPNSWLYHRYTSASPNDGDRARLPRWAREIASLHLHSARRQVDVHAGDAVARAFLTSCRPAPSSFEALQGMLPTSYAWRRAIAAARFANEPSARTLAHELRWIAEDFDGDVFMSPPIPWPLEACVRNARSSTELLGYATRAEAGEFGDYELWAQAEDEWAAAGIELDDIAKLTEDELPLCVRNGRMSPPVGALRVAIQHGSQSNEVLRDALARARSTPVREWLAKLIWDGLSQVTPQRGRPRRWTAAELGDVWDLLDFGFLDPLQGVVTSMDGGAEWRRVLNDIGLSAHTYSHGVVRALAIQIAHHLANAPQLPGLQNLALALTRGGTQVAVSEDVLRAMLTAENPTSNATAYILLFSENALRNDEIPALLQAALIDKARVLPPLLTILDRFPVRRSQSESILLSLWETRDQLTPAESAQVFELLQRALRSRPSGLASAATWDRLQLPLPRPETPAVQRAKSAAQPGSVHIESISLENVRVFKKLDLLLQSPRDATVGQWTVLLGENGVGKTTLLRAVALSLIDAADPAVLPKEAVLTNWRRNGIPAEAPARIVVTSTESRASVEFRKHGDRERLVIDGRTVRRPIFAYGCRRGSALGGNARDVRYEPGSEIATLFHEDADLIHAETWLALRHAAAVEERPKGSRQRLFDAVVHTLKQLLPGVDEIWVENARVFVAGRHLGRVPLAALSDGYLTMTGWTLDMLARWIDMSERDGEELPLDFAKTMTGVALVDEIDLHLHPAWQRRVIEDTRSVFPMMSFIVTTHNPMTLLGAHSHEIWKLSWDADTAAVRKGSETPEFLTSGEIYNAYFGVNSAFPSSVGSLVSRYNSLARTFPRSPEEEDELSEVISQLKRIGISPAIPVRDA